METKTCNLCKCNVTPTYAMKHLHEFMDKICEHDIAIQTFSQIEIVSTYNLIKNSNIVRFILVLSDTNNNNGTGLYLHDGTTIKELLLL